MHRIFFPLRTSVELFRDPESIDAVTRVKEGAVLYDEVVIEVGLLEVTIADEGSSQWWLPPSHLTPERLAHGRRIPEPGTNFSLSAGIQKGPGVPAEQMWQIIGGPVAVGYAAEFHQGILDELGEEPPDWLKLFALPDHELNAQPLSKVIGQLNFQMLGASEFMPEAGQFLRDFVYKAFHHDAVIATHMGASFSVTSLFAPMLERATASPDHAGDVALGVLVPNLSKLPWEVVQEYREHAGCVEARGKLREFDERAAATEPADALEFQRRVFQEIAHNLFGAIQELHGSAAQRLGEEAAKTAVAFIPVVGPFLGPGAAMLETLHDVLQDRQSWHAALMKLRPEQ